MSVNITAKLDFVKAKLDIREYAERVKKTVRDALNIKGIRVLFELVKLTLRGDKGKIQQQLGTITYGTRVTKKGKVKKTRSLTDVIGELIYKIVNSRRTKAGKPGLAGAQMERAALKVIGGRVRSVPFLDVGWFGAFKVLNMFSKGAGRIDRDVKQRGVPKGTATPAIEGWEARVILENNVRGKKNQGLVSKLINAPISQAINNVQADMEVYLERKNKEDVAAFNRG